MAYQVDIREPFSEEISRILHERLLLAENAIDNSDDLHAGIHEVRRNIKMIRAVLRLVRDEIGEEAYQAQNSFFRDEAKKLSFLRDLTAILETLETLKIPYREAFGVAMPRKIKICFEKRRREALEDNRETIDQVAGMLHYAHRQVQELPVQNGFSEEILKGIKRVYKRGYVAAGINSLGPVAGFVHLWRKRAKYLRYQMSLLRNVWPVVFKAFEKELHRLTDLLGNYQNLEVLVFYLNHLDLGIDESHKENLSELARQLQVNYHREALDLGMKLYAEKPRHFTERMGHYLNSAEYIA